MARRSTGWATPRPSHAIGDSLHSVHNARVGCDPATQLPSDLFALLNGPDSDATQGLSVVLASIDRKGRPHLVRLPLDELYAPDPGQVRLSLDAGCDSSDNLRLRGVLGLCLAIAGTTYDLKGVARELEGEAGAGRAGFEVQLESVAETRSRGSWPGVEPGEASRDQTRQVRSRLRALIGRGVGRPVALSHFPDP